MNAQSPVESLRASLPAGAGKMVASKAGGKTVQAFFESNKSAMAAVLPKHMDADRMTKIALRCLRTTPKLMACTLESLMAAIITCSQLGLEPNTPLGHIYLIPFENSKDKRTDVQVIIGYQGFIELVMRSGKVDSLTTRVVYERDTFELEYGTDDRIIHKPELKADPGEIIGFYAVAKLKDGSPVFEYMSRGKVEGVRNGSQGYKTAIKFKKDNTPWITNFEEMGRKTLIRRIAKYLPKSIELAAGLRLDERAEDGKVQGLGAVLDGVDYTEIVDTVPDEPNGAGETVETGETETATTKQVTHEETVTLVDLGKTAPAPAVVVTETRQDPAPRETKAAARAAPAPVDDTPDEPAGLFGSME